MAEEVARFADCELVGAFLAEETAFEWELRLIRFFLRYVESRGLACLVEYPVDGRASFQGSTSAARSEGALSLRSTILDGCRHCGRDLPVKATPATVEPPL